MDICPSINQGRIRVVTIIIITVNPVDQGALISISEVLQALTLRRAVAAVGPRLLPPSVRVPRSPPIEGALDCWNVMDVMLMFLCRIVLLEYEGCVVM